MIFFYFVEAFKYFRRSPLGSLITIITTSVAVGVTAFSILLIFLSNNISDKLKSNIEINVFLKEGASTQGKSDFENYLRNNDLVRKFNFINKSEAEKRFVRETGENFKDILEANPLPASYKIYLKPNLVDRNKIDNLKLELMNKKMVDDVVFDYSSLLSILNFINKMKLFIYILTVLLFGISLYLVYSNSKLVIKSREEIYNTMKLIGTKLFTIRFPILLNGVLIGLISSTIVVLITITLFYFAQKIYPFLNLGSVLYFIYAAIIILGIVLGFIGSFFATRNITLKLNTD